MPEFAEPAQPKPVGTPHYVLCGALQILVFRHVCGGCRGGSRHGLQLALLRPWRPVESTCGRSRLGLRWRSGSGILPIVAKWVLIGRFRPQRIRVWSLAYVRFWVVKTLVVTNPAARLFRGTMLYAMYLRALGARIGSGTVILTQHMPICTDLITVGANTVIRKDTWMNGYRAHDGVIEIGPVTIGDDAFVGERCVFDIYTRVRAGATIGHASAPLPGQEVPSGATWHGSPVRPAEPDYQYRTVGSLPVSRRRRIAFNALLGLLVVLVFAPAEAAAVSLLLAHPTFLTGLAIWDAGVIALGLLAGLLVAAIAMVGVIPRLLDPATGAWAALSPLRLSPRGAAAHPRTSHVPLLTGLFGDSVAIVALPALPRLAPRRGGADRLQLRSGCQARRSRPSAGIGTGTMVSDGCRCMNAEFSSTAFRVMPVADRCTHATSATHGVARQRPDRVTTA